MELKGRKRRKSSLETLVFGLVAATASMLARGVIPVPAPMNTCREMEDLSHFPDITYLCF